MGAEDVRCDTPRMRDFSSTVVFRWLAAGDGARTRTGRCKAAGRRFPAHGWFGCAARGESGRRRIGDLIGGLPGSGPASPAVGEDAGTPGTSSAFAIDSDSAVTRASTNRTDDATNSDQAMAAGSSNGALEVVSSLRRRDTAGDVRRIGPSVIVAARRSVLRG